MPSLKVMLAASEIPPADSLKFPLMASPKIDGVRCAMIDDMAYSRKMLPFENPYLAEWAKTHRNQLHGLDGELTVGPPMKISEEDDVFNRSSGPLGRKHGEPDFTYHVFERWDCEGHWGAWARYQSLMRQYEHELCRIPRVVVVQQKLVESLSDLHAEMQAALDLGYEGLILKHPAGVYKNGRSTLNEGILMKWKEFGDSEAQVIGWKQGTTNQNELQKDELGHAKRSTAKAGKVPVDTLGSWLVRDIYSGMEFSCPPAGTAEEVKQMWLDREQHLHKVLTYKFQKVGTLRKPRFPGMVRWRPLSDISEPAPFLIRT